MTMRDSYPIHENSDSQKNGQQLNLSTKKAKNIKLQNVFFIKVS